MSGKRLGSFRSGDRSEYLAVYGMSRLAFVDPIPRQEDFGVLDFLCVLTREEKGNVYPESAFYLQVKSNDNDIELGQDAIRWITQHMDHPLFVCVVDKKDSTLALYSTSPIWPALFLKTHPTSIVLRLGGALPLDTPTAQAERFELDLGPPVLKQSISGLEEDSGGAFAVLKDWIQIDSANISRRNMGRIATRTIVRWQTNVPPSQDPTAVATSQSFLGPDYGLSERHLAPVLTALAHNYRRAGDKAKLNAICEYLRTIRGVLDAHGQEFADGKLTT